MVPHVLQENPAEEDGLIVDKILGVRTGKRTIVPVVSFIVLYGNSVQGNVYYAEA
jgi:hypothetical protein